MKTKKLLLGLMTFTVIAVSSALYFERNTVDSNDITEEKHDKKDQKGIAGAMDFYYRLKADVVTGNIETDKIVAARTAVRKMSSSKSLGLSWEELGPNNVGGRIRALIFDNQDNTNNTMYAGGVQGGLWKSTNAGQSWVQVPIDGNIAITSMCQTPAGDIYVGTGEGLAQAAYTNRNSGGIGAGIYLKEATSTDFDIISNTITWKYINRLASDKNGKVYAATSSGLKSTTDKGTTSWNLEKGGNFKDVKCLEDETRVVATMGNKIQISDGDGSWDQSSPGNGQRAEVAIAPSDKDVIYVTYANNGGLDGIYKTTNGGSSWTLVGQGGISAFNLFGSNNQGWYDNVLMVHKTNPNIVYAGGIDLWKGVKISDNAPYSWTKKTLWHADKISPIYVHADQHVYTQHPTEANTFYQGTDGGISKTTDGGNTFVTLNTDFNVTQFYAVGTHPNGGVMGGTQDNGTQFIDGSATHPSQKQEAREILGGDGGWCAASILNQEVVFASIYYGTVARSSDFGQSMQKPSDETVSPATPEFYSQAMLDNLAGAFVTPTIIWETISYPNSRDSVNYSADQDYVMGDTIDGRSATNNAYPFEYILTADLNYEDTIKIVDPVQSRFFVGTADGIWMTKEALYFKKTTPSWSLIMKNPTPANKAVWSMQISRDGDVLYYVYNGELGRLSNLLEAQEDSTASANSSAYVIEDVIIKNFSGMISSVSIDPDNSANIVVTIGGTSSNSIYYSSNATSSSPTFSSAKGNLPSNTPVYSSLIPLNNPNYCIIGTEFGIFTTNNITSSSPTWTKENTGFESMAPVYQIIQQQNSLAWKKTVTLDQGIPLVQIYPGVYNHAQIYAATHGRGFFTCKNFMSIEDEPSDNKKYISDIKLYPNPVVDNATVEYLLTNKADVTITIFDINGRLLSETNLGSKSGQQSTKVNTSNLTPGLYILQLRAGTDVTTSKFIKN
ncbi:MAG: T9SS type A sorting domain-containing protein [Bacteroidales bacterium]|nr:T9SS type A sorting domain-containing protein [Bacteroidales bacterium]